MSTAGAIIDVKKGKMTFEVGNEKDEFILPKFLQDLAMNSSCFSINIIDESKREFETPTEIIKLPSTEIVEDDGIKVYSPMLMIVFMNVYHSPLTTCLSLKRQQ